MKHAWIVALAAGVVLPVAAGAQTCTTTIDATAPLARYAQHGDGTVTDLRTGLRWQRCPVGYTLDDGGTALDYSDDACDVTGQTTFDWQGALQAAESLNNSGGFAGITSWRVPNIKELVSTVEQRCAAPAVNALVFPGVPAGAVFWSSTSYISLQSSLALRVEQGTTTTAFRQNSPQHLRLVR